VKLVPASFESAPKSLIVSHQRSSELDGIRAVAISMVLLAHGFFAFPNAPGALDGMPVVLKQLIGHGWLGVDLFFILSGFLISGILLDAKSKPAYFRNFYVRRVLRIMPLYFAAILVWSLFYRDSAEYFLLSSAFGANLSAVLHIHEPHGPGVLWSLAVEEHFYFIWPVLIYGLTARGALFASVAIFVGTPILRAIYAAKGMDPDVIYMLSWFRFDGLAMGAMLAIWSRSRFAGRQPALILAAAMLAGVMVLTVAGWPAGILKGGTIAATSLRYTQAYLVFGAFFALVVAYQHSAWTAPLRWRLMQITAGLSYCIYLIHLSLGDAYEWLVARSGWSPVATLGPTGAVMLRVTVMVVLSYAVAMVAKRWIEDPFLALKDRFTQRGGAPSLVAPVAGLSATH
jgi:peptidoglycan/LPS O-acetylase OafA/YrhL